MSLAERLFYRAPVRELPVLVLARKSAPPSSHKIYPLVSKPCPTGPICEDGAQKHGIVANDGCIHVDATGSAITVMSRGECDEFSATNSNSSSLPMPDSEAYDKCTRRKITIYVNKSVNEILRNPF